MDPSDDKYQTRARIGVGACVGAAFGAIVAAIIYKTSTAGWLGTFVGAVLGGVIGSRIRSQAFQYIWYEYSPKVAVRLSVSGFFITGFMVAFFYAIESSNSTALQLALLAGTLISMVFLGHSVKFAISELDDMLRSVIKEAVVFGFVMALCIFFILGLVTFIVPLPSHWMFPFIVLMFSLLIGRLYAAWKYR